MAKHTTGQERRRFHRIELDEAVSVVFADESGGSCRIKNISLGGMFVAGSSARKAAEHCRVSLFHHATSDTPRLQATATVAWSSEEGVGLQFTAMTYDSYMVLLSTLINNAERPAIILREFPKDCPFSIIAA